jgi:murein DD-endopeptidase MepM/ murein hydrolase activator NlpD
MQLLLLLLLISPNLAYANTPGVERLETIVMAQVASVVPAVPVATPNLELDKTIVKQGQVIVAKFTEQKHKPVIYFTDREFTSYKIGEKSYWTAIPVENLTKIGDYKLVAKAGDWSKEYTIKVIDNQKGVQHIHLADDKDDIVATQKELNAVGSGLHADSEAKLWTGKFVYPNKAYKSSPFGVRRSYNNGPLDSYHKGLDFAAGTGSAVTAPAAGKVVMVGFEKDGFAVHGNSVILDHGHGITSIYMHLNTVDVKIGDLLKVGDKIGTVGHTGISTGPHLHWGVYAHGISTDPELFVSRDLSN